MLGDDRVGEAAGVAVSGHRCEESWPGDRPQAQVRHGLYGGGPGHVLQQRDLTEAVAGTQLTADLDNLCVSVLDDEELLPRIADSHDRCSRGHRDPARATHKSLEPR